MHPVRISGTELADALRAKIAARHLPSTKVLVGFVASQDPAGISFQQAKQRAAASVGITYSIAVLPHSSDSATAAAAIRAALAGDSCDGVVIQLPLPKHFDTDEILSLVPPEKDPDVLGSAAADWVLTDEGPVLPPAARTVQLICASQGFSVSGKIVAVVGMGRLVGQPVALWLKTQDAHVLELDQGFDEAALAGADLVILGTGAYTLDPKLLKDGAGVIDFGYRRTEAGPSGDLDTSDPAALEHLSFYTPTPGGTGPILIASLLENFARLAMKPIQ